MGRTCRALSIASRLAATYPACTILLATDLPIIGRFKFPTNVDCIRLPVLGSGRRDGRRNGLDLPHESVLAVRRRILRSVARTFRPNVVIIERDPCTHREETTEILSQLREDLPETKVVWALPDVLGEPQWLVRQWKHFDVTETLVALCDEIWVHGERSLFDQAERYGFPAELAGKLIYTGYVSPLTSGTDSERSSDEERSTPPRHAGGRPKVLLTAGSGALGYPLVDSYLRFLERRTSDIPFDSVIVSGPMMPGPQRAELMERAERLPGLVLTRFSQRLPEYVQDADVILSNGGYNIHSASLTYQKPALLAPSHSPPNERLQRARVFHPLGWVDVIPPDEVDSERLGQRLLEVASTSREGHGATMQRVPLHGMRRITNRIGLLARSRRGTRVGASPHTETTGMDSVEHPNP